MKKFLIAAALALSATMANAWDFTVNGNRDIDGKVNGAGLSLGKTVDGIGFAVSVDRFDYKAGNLDVYSGSVGYEFVKVLGVGLGAQFGISFNDSGFGRDGWSYFPGLVVNVPVTKKVSLVTEVNRHFGEDKIKYLDGTVVSLGVKYSF